MMKKKVIMIVVGTVFVIAKFVYALDEGSHGICYPLGSNILGSYSGWMASGCNSSTGYFDEEYHIAHDFEANVGDSVYAVSDGVVRYISSNGWGTGNVGVFVRHELKDGSDFLALYGHVRMDFQVGDRVLAGMSFATIGSWPYGVHLHFGIIPKNAIPSSNFGRMPCSSWPDTNSFTNPIAWIDAEIPKNNFMYKFSDSNVVYYYSNRSLWPVKDATTYAKLGYSYGCQVTGSGITSSDPDWDNVIEIPESKKHKYSDLIKDKVFLTQGSLVRIVDEVGPNTCLPRTLKNPGTLYVLDCGRFRPFYEWEVCQDFGYTEDDIVDITQELFNEYGEWYPIYHYDNAFCFPQYGGGDFHDDPDQCFSDGFDIEVSTVSSSKLNLNIQSMYGDACTCVKATVFQNGIELAGSELLDNCTQGEIEVSNLNADTEYCFYSKLLAREGIDWNEVGQTSEVCGRTLVDSGGGGEGDLSPEARFTSNTTSGQVPLTINFTNNSTSPNGSIVSHDWDFGDGVSDSTENPSYTFTQVGSYTVVLTASDELGESDTYSSTINVTECVDCSSCDSIEVTDEASGSLVRVNGYLPSSQTDLAMVKLDSNSFALAWESNTQDASLDSIVTTVYRLDENFKYPEAIVNSFTSGNQRSPQLLKTANGYLVVWESYAQDGDKNGVYGRFFTNQGIEVSDEFQINTYTADNQQEPALAGSSAHDNILVVWESDEQDGDDEGVYGQLFNQSSMQVVGNEFRINSTTSSDQKSPSVSIDPNTGHFFVVWYSYDSTSERNIILQELDQNGNKVGEEVVVASGSKFKYYPKVLVLSSTRIAVTWNGARAEGQTTPYSIFGQIVNLAAKNKIGGVFDVNNCEEVDVDDGDYTIVKVPNTSDFQIVWGSTIDLEDGRNIYSQRVNSSGNNIGGLVRVNVGTIGDQRRPSMVFIDQNKHIIGWDADHEEAGDDTYNTYIQGFNINLYDHSVDASDALTPVIIGIQVIDI